MRGRPVGVSGAARVVSCSYPMEGTTMTRTTSDVSALRTAMTGPVLEPGDAGYDEARDVYNGDVERRPAVIARCTSPADVAAALAHAQADRPAGRRPRRRARLLGGERRRADDRPERVGRGDGRPGRPAGALRRRRQLARRSTRPPRRTGSPCPAGTVSHTGVGGLTLGRRLRLADRASSAWRSTTWSRPRSCWPTARCVRASATEHPDLFWALRGGGGNFGVVTEFEFRLHQVGPIVQFGLLFWRAGPGPRGAADGARRSSRSYPPGSRP